MYFMGSRLYLIWGRGIRVLGATQRHRYPVALHEKNNAPGWKLYLDYWVTNCLLPSRDNSQYCVRKGSVSVIKCWPYEDHIPIPGLGRLCSAPIFEKKNHPMPWVRLYLFYNKTQYLHQIMMSAAEKINKRTARMCYLSQRKSYHGQCTGGEIKSASEKKA